MQKTLKMTETFAPGYSSQSTQQELSNKYQHDRVYMVFRNLDGSSLGIGQEWENGFNFCKLFQWNISYGYIRYYI